MKMLNGKIGSGWRKNPDSIMRGYGAWSDMTYIRNDGKKFVIPADILKNDNKTKEIIEKIKAHDSETEALFRKAE